MPIVYLIENFFALCASFVKFAGRFILKSHVLHLNMISRLLHNLTVSDITYLCISVTVNKPQRPSVQETVKWTISDKFPTPESKLQGK